MWCPKCFNIEFFYEKLDSNDEEIAKDKLCCRKCGFEFEVIWRPEIRQIWVWDQMKLKEQ